MRIIAFLCLSLAFSFSLSCPAKAAAPDPATPVAAPVPAPPAPVQNWQVDRKKSSIRFSSFKNGQPFSIDFQSWSAEIAFDPTRLEESRAIVTIDTTSGSKGEATFKDYLVTPSWFSAAELPRAQFQSKKFRQIGDNLYEVSGVLNLYNKEQTNILPVPTMGIPFRTVIKGKKGEFISNFTFAVPDFSPAPSVVQSLKRPFKKINFAMTLKTVKAKPATPTAPVQGDGK